MQMYRLTEDDLLTQVGQGFKTPLARSDLFSKDIKLNYLKRIDKIFEKGLHYYLDPKAPEDSKEASIFFRKTSFATDELSLGAVKTVNKFEELKLSLEAIATLSEIEYTRKIRKYNINENSQRAALEIRELINPVFTEKRRDFLKLLISKLAEMNVLVFEFIETHNKKEKANIDGFFLKPNFIVLKRHQSFRREIFTLAHELGHYLLDEEEVEKIDYFGMAEKNISKIERWCNDFAFAFLAGPYLTTLNSLGVANSTNDYHISEVEQISKKTHLSEMAIFTRLLYQKQISPTSYSNIRNDYQEQFQLRQKEKEREKQLLKEQGIKQRGSVAQPIPSPLFISTIQTAFYEGILNEYEVSKRLNIKPEKLEKYIQ
ncbi:ImmA/IrrE family metallo-endopeptidase [Roseivirga sp.]|uniref:ImmA/IrrE family metallo-endopeptidase n=1 Tax=Roseivirga sp. TaxID=1964215 RepID=UPI002B27AA11|nr:ImmA/IrrE family metallo-endopeptidase [Roseivirga sp.]